MRPTYWIINKYHFGGVIAAFLQIFIRYGHREYLSTLFYILLVMAIPSALAVEFNLNVLDKSMRDRIDISLLKEKGGIAPGEYFVSVAVNNNQISNGQKIDWKKNGDQTIPCINDLLVDKFGLKPEVRQSLPRLNQCVDFSSRLKFSSFLIRLASN